MVDRYLFMDIKTRRHTLNKSAGNINVCKWKKQHWWLI